MGDVTVKFPPLPASETSAEVRFTYDMNGILEVEVHVLPTNEKYRSIIEENPGVLTQEEIAEKLKRLEKLKIHQRDKRRKSSSFFPAQKDFMRRASEKSGNSLGKK